MEHDLTTLSTLGKLGESYACNFLLKRGYSILEKRFRSGNFSEIDIIASKDRTISFVEVKTRVEFDIKEHYKSIDEFKIRKIKRGVSKFLSLNPKYYNYEHQIQAAIVLINPYSRLPKVVFYDYLD